MHRVLILGIGVLALTLNPGCSSSAEAAQEAPAGVPVVIFDGEALAGWKALGDASYRVDEGAILGEVDGGGQSFLVSEREFGDFVLEVELRNELPGNSGIQVRSHVNDAGRMFGYQIEIDPSERAWSGGLYDEARRGWLDDLKDNDAARAAFRLGEWNVYRIECRGAWIRTWVNGVPAADHLDAMDLSGFFGLQVHNGNNTRVRWRNFELVDFGTRAWQPLDLANGWVEANLQDSGDAARFDLKADENDPGRLEFDFRIGSSHHELRQADGESQEPRPSVRRVHVMAQGRRRVLLVDGRPLGEEILLDVGDSLSPLRLRAGPGLEVVGAAELGAPQHTP